MKKVITILITLQLLLLAACGSAPISRSVDQAFDVSSPAPTSAPFVPSTPEPTATPSPTPTPSPEPTNTPEPEASDSSMSRSNAMNVAQDEREGTAPTPDPTPDPTPQPEPASYEYVLNTNTHKFHHSWCSSVDQMKDSNKSYYTGSRDDVISMGYDPCKRCNP